MRVKICGITNLADALVCQQYGADALGFIFYRGSKRYIAPEEVQEIITRLSPFITKIGVFVNESVNTINKIATKVGLNAVQLHGEEAPEYISQIHLPVIKSFRIDPEFDYGSLIDYKNCYYLLDSYSPEEYGGTGTTFNWQRIPEELRESIILAGGISIDNIDVICRDIRPAAIDVSSALESFPGKKDPEKIKRFMNKYKNIKKHITKANA